MRKATAIVASAALAMVLASCSGGSSPASQEQQASPEAQASQEQQASRESHGQPDGAKAGEAASDEAPVERQDLVIEDSAYTATQGGYVKYAVSVTNPNDGFLANSFTITATARDADGRIAFSDDWTVGPAQPMDTSYWATQVAGSGAGAEFDSLEFAVSVNSDDWYELRGRLAEPLYDFDNVSVFEDSFGNMKVTGEITYRNGEAKLGRFNIARPMLVCILKDADGKIVGGFNSYTLKDLVLGEAAPFDFSAGFGPVDYETVEMYGNPWF